MRLRDELVLGRHKLSTIFGNSPALTIKTGDIGAGCRLERRDLPASRRVGMSILRFRQWASAIIDMYLPGDVVGLDTVLRTRPLEEVLTLTAVTIEAIAAADALIKLMAYRPTALSVAWLLGQRQRRADHLLAAISGLDARGRLAMMVLNFYMCLRRRRSITESIYNLHLTQIPNPPLPRPDCGAYQPGITGIARRADRQLGETLRDHPRSQAVHDLAQYGGTCER